MDAESVDRGGERKRRRTEELGTPEDSTALEPEENADSFDPPKPKGVACKHCRQSKVRCNSAKHPCSRCQRLGVACETDKTYKRVSKTSKIEELERHVQHMRDVLNQNVVSSNDTLQLGNMVAQSPPVEVPPPTFSAIPAEISTFNSRRAVHTTRETTATVPFDPAKSRTPPGPQNITQRSYETLNKAPEHAYSRPVAVKVRAIESTALGMEQIDSLFDIFFQNFHPFFAILDPCRSPDEYYENSLLLFWTIIGIAARRYGKDASLLTTLSRVITKHAWETISEPLPVLQDIQALLILCMWPFPTTHLWSSHQHLTFGNFCTNSAMHMGLHRPENPRDFAKTAQKNIHLPVDTAVERQERQRTWAGCNIVAQYATNTCGNPPTGSCFEWGIDRACETNNAHSLSDDLRYHLICQRFCHRVTVVMTSNVSNSLGLPSDAEYSILMSTLEHDLDVMEGEFGNVLSTIDQLYLRAARLHLYSFHWHNSSLSEQRRIGILKAYTTASAFITQVQCANSSSNLLTYCPIVFPRTLFASGCILLKVLNSRLSQFVDYEAGITIFQIAITALRQCSLEENDMSTHAANILAEVWQYRGDNPATKHEEPTLSVRSRTSASIAVDCLRRWKFHTAQASGNVTDLSVSTTSTGRRQPGINQTDNPTQHYDFNGSGFDWDQELFKDLSWPWDFNVPP